MSSLSVMKLVGTGNDFLFIDGRLNLPGKFAQVSRSQLAPLLCDRHFGLGADGLVFVDEVDGKYRWDFYNTDGSHAEMCGNATRCLGRWASLKLGVNDIEFTTAAGQAHVTVTGDDVSSVLNFVSAHPRDLLIQVGDREVKTYFVNTGVPHFVVVTTSIEKTRSDHELIHVLRFHTEAGSRGSNVTFLEVTGDTSFKTVTYERGVEDFTLSCGTGVVAAAAVGLQVGSTGLEADVETPGGRLKVKFGKGFEGVTLTGPAVKIFETQVEPAILGSKR